MTGCPMAYPDACASCVYYGKCPPSQAVEKLEQLQNQFAELRTMLEQMAGAKN